MQHNLAAAEDLIPSGESHLGDHDNTGSVCI